MIVCELNGIKDLQKPHSDDIHSIISVISNAGGGGGGWGRIFPAARVSGVP